MNEDKQTYILVNDRVRQNAMSALRTAPADYVVTLAPRTRSNDQNAMFHAICSDIAKSGHLFAGKPRKPEVWKVLLISGHAAATGDGNEVVPGFEGEFVNIRESSARMSVRRASSLIEYTLAYCDTNGIPLTATKRGGYFDEWSASFSPKQGKAA
jgi:hypothetical protein